MPELPQAAWIAMRAEWENTNISDRKLGERWNVSGVAVLHRRRREGWKRIADGETIISFAAAKRALAENAVSDPEPPVSKPSLSDRMPVLTKVMKEEARNMISEAAVEGVIQSLAARKGMQLEDADKIRALGREYAAMAMAVLTGDQAEANAAAGRILASDKENLSSVLATVLKLLQGAQVLEDRALGVAERKEISVNGGASLVRQDGDRAVIDATQITTRHLEALQEVIALVDGHHGTDLPLPPMGPEEESER